MKKDRFLFLINNYKSTDTKDPIELVNLQKQYPYSQMIRTLAASVTQTHQLPNVEKQIRLAALYATNRSLLKKILNATTPLSQTQPVPTKNIESNPTSVESTIETSFPKKPSFFESETQSTHSPSEIDRIIEELPLNVSKLKERRLNFELLAKEVEDLSDKKLFNKSKKKAAIKTPRKKVVARKTIAKKSVTRKAVKKVQKKKTVTRRTTKKVQAKKPAARKTTKKVQAKKPAARKTTKKVQAKKSTARKTSKKVQVKKPAKRKTTKTKNNISRANSSSKKSTGSNNPRSPDQAKQIKIINDFIENNILSTSPQTERMSHPYEISEPAKEDNVSEALVRVLISQGDRKKAIDVLKKLIWKFPQKKTYFTAQINLLKNDEF